MQSVSWHRPPPTGEVMYVEGADHGMQVGGARSSNAVHMDIVDRVRAFAKRLAGKRFRQLVTGLTAVRIRHIDTGAVSL